MPFDLDFGTSDYEGVRAAIDVNFTANELPESVIRLPIYEGEAIRVMERVGKDLSDEKQTEHNASFKIAATLYAASLICLKIRHLVRSDLADNTQQYQTRDFERLSDDLQKQAFEIVGEIIEDENPTTSTDLSQYFFRTVGACKK